MPQWLADELAAQRPRLLLWTPVLTGIGIAAYYALPDEPPVLAGWLAGLAGAGLLLAGWLWRGRARVVPAVLVGCLLLGFANAQWRTHQVAAPVIGWHYHGPVIGRIVAVDRSAGNAQRLLLDQVHLPGRDPASVPQRVRVSVYGTLDLASLAPGTRVATTGYLSPPTTPAEPDGFDFRFLAWFDRIGAVGYTRNPVLAAGPARDGDTGVPLARTRAALADGIRARIPGQPGAFAAAILTGDRSEIDPANMAHLRAANLAHLLAISGLHMGLLTGFVFLLVRYGLALAPPLALRINLKKLAAVAALVAGAAYLALSGGTVPTQRAFVMIAVVLLAVLLNRPALTLNAVAVAALVVLAIAPEGLLQPGFQMSFAATTALIATFEQVRTRGWLRARPGQGRWQGVWLGGLTLALVTVVSDIATAPFSAFHFNRMGLYGLPANLLAVPLMGLLIMPAAVVAALLAPLGLDGAPMWLMGRGIAWVLFVAEYFATLPMAERRIPAGSSTVLALIALGGLVLVLWAGRLRLVGLGLVAAGLMTWTGAERPVLLINDNGRLIGLMTEAGRALNRDSAYAFQAQIWLENDGDNASQPGAAARPGLRVQGRETRADLPGGWQLWHSTATDDALPPEACAPRVLLIAPRATRAPDGPCLFLGEPDLRRTGALAVRRSDTGLRIETARQNDRRRLWTGWRTPQ